MALIGKSGSVQEPPKKSKFAQNCVFGHRKPTQRTHSDDIWPVSVDLGAALAHQNWPSSLKGGRYMSPQNCQNLPKIVAFGHRKPIQLHNFKFNDLIFTCAQKLTYS